MHLVIIVPVLNEEKSIKEYLERINKVIDKIDTKFKIELLFVNNCSSDDTLAEIKNYMNKYNFKINYISFTRNFGYQASIFCGLKSINADAYFINDVDLEDPPELLLEFIDYYNKDYKVIYGIRNNREGNKFMKIFRNFYYFLLSKIADNSFTPYMAEFSLLDKEVRDNLIKNETNFPFIRSEISYLGFKKKGVNYLRKQRTTGKTNYNIIGVFKFAISGILSSSTFFLRFNSYLGILLILFNIILFILGQKFQINFYYIFLTNISILILMLSFISLYVARIYKEIIKKPLYIIDNEDSSFDLKK